MDRLIIVAITPPILEKGLVWFEQHKQRIEKASSPFWQRNTLTLRKDQKITMSEVVRTLYDFGYQKYQDIELPGEFSQTGGILNVFPVNSEFALKIEFLGNTVETIYKTSKLNPDPQKPLNKVIYNEGARRKEPQSDLSKLKPGDFVVHLDHGIGLFAGKSQTVALNSQTLEQDTSYIIEYAGGDKLIVPENVSYKLSPYLGFSNPTIYRLGGNLWHKTKKRVNQDIIKTAKELLRIYARREVATRPPYDKDSDMTAQLEQGFEFQETADQAIAIDKVMKDLDKNIPMDRLICGDVGFGKTEVALRAAARSVFSGKQTAIIAPTTILAWQHFNTFKSRLEKFPVRIELLTRIQKNAAQKEIVSRLKSGNVDLVIGTHRILQKDVGFKNLGLLIIDEEQRFGVKQKEKLKSFRSELDVLSLSATPIPRTLYFSMSGLKDISNIQTPPQNRLPIHTFVMPKSKSIVKKAIQKELERHGQVYYLHNRVATIESARKRIGELGLGEVKISVGHAKLPENHLISIIQDFRDKKTDILVATTIIENGLDLSNVNTLIVEDATRLGLSQAHQLRGRIGRGDKQAYAYFLYSPKKLTDIAKRRLKTLKEYQGLGDGYQIAMRDLEIRGAGNILGREQHGSINKVGLNLYCQMLNEAVERLKTENL